MCPYPHPQTPVSPTRFLVPLYLLAPRYAEQEQSMQVSMVQESPCPWWMPVFSSRHEVDAMHWAWDRPVRHPSIATTATVTNS